MTYQPKVYRKQGGDELVIASGGTLTVQSGSTVTMTGGNQSLGNVTIGGYLTHPFTSVAAAGSAQGNGTALTSGVSLVTGADGTKGVVLPTAAAGLTLMVKQDAATASGNGTLKLYPASGGYINNGSQNAAVSMGNGTAVTLVGGNTTHFYTWPGTPS